MDCDGLLSNSDLHRLITELNIFVTEEEIRKIFTIIDDNKDGLVDESDFVQFFLSPSNKVIRKAEAIYNSAIELKEWLHLSVGTNQNAAQNLWSYFRKRHEILNREPFPDCLNVHDIMLISDNLGHRLAFSQAQALFLLIVPDKRGSTTITLADLQAFMNRKCRSFGTLLAIFEKELCKDAISCYRKHVEAIYHDGIEHYELADYFKTAVKELADSIKSAPNSEAVKLNAFSKVISSSPTAVPQTPSNLNMNHFEEHLASLQAFKDGIEKKIPNGYKGLTLEEYCLLGLLTNSVVWDDNGISAIAVNRFIYGICAHAVELYSFGNNVEQKIERHIEKLQEYIRESAIVVKDDVIVTRRILDFSVVFSIFDEECHGFVKREEFCSILHRMKLCTVDSFIPKIYDAIDVHKKGFVILSLLPISLLLLI